jgi:hypothetical protein
MDIYAQVVSTSQRRALQQLSAFAESETKPAELETAALGLDFSAEEKSAPLELRSNSRSKTFHIN